MAEIAAAGTREGAGSIGIVGAGIVGLATAMALERRGVGYEIFEPGAPGGGQSRGGSRLYWYEKCDPDLVGLALESMRIWNAWEHRMEVELISRRGILTFGTEVITRLEGSPQEPVSREAGPDRHVRLLTGEEAARHLPALDRVDEPVALDPAGATIWAQVAIGSLFSQVGQAVIPRRVDGLTSLADGRVEIRAGDIRRVYDAVVVAAGTSTPDLARPLGVEIPVSKRARVRTIHEVRPRVSGRVSSGFRELRHRGETVEGSPMRGYGRFGVGVDGSVQTDGEGRVDPDSINRRVEDVTDFVGELMPGLVPEPSRAHACWVTELPWGRDGIGIWRSGQVLFPAGANMFRLAPVLGEALSDAAGGLPVRPELRPDNRLGEVPAVA